MKWTFIGHVVSLKFFYFESNNKVPMAATIKIPVWALNKCVLNSTALYN